LGQERAEIEMHAKQGASLWGDMAGGPSVWLSARSRAGYRSKKSRR
jgi:hypothetical protein